MQVQATQIRKGMVIRFDNELYTVLETNHVTPGNWRAMVFAKMRNLKTGSSMEQRFRSTDRVEQVMTEQKDAEYLYASGTMYTFMDTTTYEQVEIDRTLIEEAVSYLLPNMQVKIDYIDNALTGITLPSSVELEVVDTEPGLKSATVTNVFKPAKLETGITVQVPPFVDVGEKIRVDTRTGEYLERVGKK
jgi:elongation factor P